MIAIGVVLILVGFIVKVAAMWTAGFVLLAIGLVLLFFGWRGRPVAGRRYWY